MDTIMICRTCPRDLPESGKFGSRLRDKLKEQLAASVGIIMVQCLGSCRKPCAVAFDAPDKVRVRLSGVNLHDLNSLVCALDIYVCAEDTSGGSGAFPSSLKQKISALAPKPDRASR